MNQVRFGQAEVCVLEKELRRLNRSLHKWLVLARFSVVLVLMACLATGGCTVFSRKKKQPPAATEQNVEPRRIGTVALVNGEMHFALVDTGSPYQPPPGTALKTFANGQQTGILNVSKERKPPFVAADIVQGSPGHGDDVME